MCSCSEQAAYRSFSWEGEMSMRAHVHVDTLTRVCRFSWNSGHMQEQETSDSALMHWAYYYAVLCYCVVYCIVAVEVIMTSYFSNFCGGDPSAPQPFPPPIHTHTHTASLYETLLAIQKCMSLAICMQRATKKPQEIWEMVYTSCCWTNIWVLNSRRDGRGSDWEGS